MRLFVAPDNVSLVVDLPPSRVGMPNYLATALARAAYALIFSTELKDPMAVLEIDRGSAPEMRGLVILWGC